MARALWRVAKVLVPVLGGGGCMHLRSLQLRFMREGIRRGWACYVSRLWGGRAGVSCGCMGSSSEVMWALERVARVLLSVLVGLSELACVVSRLPSCGRPRARSGSAVPSACIQGRVGLRQMLLCRRLGLWSVMLR